MGHPVYYYIFGFYGRFSIDFMQQKVDNFATSSQKTSKVLAKPNPLSDRCALSIGVKKTFIQGVPKLQILTCPI